MAIKIRTRLKRKLPNPEVIARAYVSEGAKLFEHIGDRHVKERERRVTTWRRKPGFGRQVGRGITRISLVVFLTSPSDIASDIWHWLDKGTSVRYAVMEPGFRAKTAPGRVNPLPHKGGMWYVNPRVPRPGIKPRFFERDIIKKLAKPTADGLRRIGARALKRRR